MIIVGTLKDINDGSEDSKFSLFHTHLPTQVPITFLHDLAPCWSSLSVIPFGNSREPEFSNIQ